MEAKTLRHDKQIIKCLITTQILLLLEDELSISDES